MFGKKRSNFIVNLSVNGIQVEGVSGVCQTIFNYFYNHIKSKNHIQGLCIENLYFLSLDFNDVYVLINLLMKRR